jgi:16S rRNA (guanine966-N2)-methyltransferase
MRIIAGLAKGRRIKGPPGLRTRPMTDRVREAVFSMLGSAVAGSQVLDLYAGTGSLGLESLSRGADAAVFVERDRAALGALRGNIAAVDLGGEVFAGDVTVFLERAEGCFDLVFVDPPYAVSLASVEQVLGLVAGVVSGGGVIVLHRRADADPVPAPMGCTVVDHRSYGDSGITRMAKEVAG